jgi:hypothetical protein
VLLSELNNILPKFRIGLCASLFALGMFSGYYCEHLRFLVFKDQIKASEEAQELSNENKISQQNNITDSIKNNFDADSISLDAYYNSVQSKSHSDALPTFPKSAARSHGSTANNLPAQCAKTTLMLVTLQQWITDQENLNDTK